LQAEDGAEAATSPRGGGGRATSPKAGAGAGSKATVSRRFRVQLTELMETLNRTRPNYVRCIKPNAEKAANAFTGQMVCDQLTYSGVFEAVKIQRSGFPFRMKHHDFVRRYHMLTLNARSRAGAGAAATADPTRGQCSPADWFLGPAHPEACEPAQTWARCWRR
jgi:myosin heavy subunit